MPDRRTVDSRARPTIIDVLVVRDGREVCHQRNWSATFLVPKPHPAEGNAFRSKGVRAPQIIKQASMNIGPHSKDAVHRNAFKCTATIWASRSPVGVRHECACQFLSRMRTLPFQLSAAGFSLPAGRN